MPISIEGLQRAGLEKRSTDYIRRRYHYAPAPYLDTKLPFLADVIVLPPPYPFPS